MKKQELIEKLKAAGTVASNVFIPVSDVIKMVEELETESSELDEDFINDIAREIVYQLDRKGSDVVSYFNIDADVSGSTIDISISDISFEGYEIECIVESAVKKYVANKEETKEEEES